MELLQLLLSLLFLTLVYNIGQLFWLLKWGIHGSHYFLGFNTKIFDVTIKGIKVSIGLYIPLFPLNIIYEIKEGRKHRIRRAWEWSEYSLWKRLVASLGGVFSLLLTGIMIFIIVSLTEVEQYIPKKEVNRHGIYPSKAAQMAGFETGDKVISINGKDYESFTELIRPEEGMTYQVLRAGKKMNVIIDKPVIAEMRKEPNTLFLYLNTPFIVEEVRPASPAAIAGLKKGDRIAKVNGVPVLKLFEFKKEIWKDNDQKIELEVEHSSDTATLFKATVAVDVDRLMGFSSREDIRYSDRRNGIGEAIIKGITRSFKVVPANILGLRTISPKGDPMISETPMSIGPAYYNGIIWERFFRLTGTLCIIVAFLSLLPLPRAPFWEVIPIVYEGTRGSMFPNKWYNVITKIGYFLIGALLLYQIGLDFYRNLF